MAYRESPFERVVGVGWGANELWAARRITAAQEYRIALYDGQDPPGPSSFDDAAGQTWDTFSAAYAAKVSAGYSLAYAASASISWELVQSLTSAVTAVRGVASGETYSWADLAPGTFEQLFVAPPSGAWIVSSTSPNEAVRNRLSATEFFAGINAGSGGADPLEPWQDSIPAGAARDWLSGWRDFIGDRWAYVQDPDISRLAERVLSV